MKKNTVSNYDGITKQLLDHLENERMINFINSAFSRNYRKDASVTRMATETYDSETKQKRCDYFVKINDDLFLIEIQSYEDQDMALRIFEYGSRGALLHSRNNIDENTIVIQLPEPVVFYLRKDDGKVRDKLSVKILRSGSDEEYEYTAKVVYVEDYDFDGLIENDMLPLIPFYPMRFEKVINNKHSIQDEKRIFEDISECYEKLKQEVINKKIGYQYFTYISNAMANVLGGMVKRMYKKGKLIDKKGAEIIMQKMIDDPVEMFDIYKALDESRNEGRTEGRTELADELLKMGVPKEVITKGLDALSAKTDINE